MTVMLRTLTVLVVIAAVAPAQPPPGGRAAEIAALAEKWEPAHDDWATEVQYEQAKHQLAGVFAALSATLAPGSAEIQEFLAPEWRRPGSVDEHAPARTRTVGAVTVRDFAAAHLPPGEALRRLVQDLLQEPRPRIEFKIFRVTPLDGPAYAIQVYVQAYGAVPAGVLQRNATWTLAFAPGADAGHPRLGACTVEDERTVAMAAPPLVECTGAVLGGDPLFAHVVLRGGEHWFGKVDAVGEINYFGHNGIAVGDVNGDGLEDLYVGMPTGLPNRLYLQNPDGTAREAAAEAGVDWLDDTKGVLLIDDDNDGDLDLFCAMGPTIVVARNDGAGRFTPARALRAATDAAFYSLAAADFDGDGDLDVYATRYVKVQYGISVPSPFHDANNGPPNHLLRNDGAKGFTDVTEAVGLGVNNSRFSLAASWCDYDGDGDPDLYVANDFGRNNLYRNDRGRFTDVAAAAGAEDQAAGMGVSWADADHDGDFDLYVSNMFSSAGQRIAYQPRFKNAAGEEVRRRIQRQSLGNTLLVNRGDGTFDDRSERAGVRFGRWAWGAEFVDLDGDGGDDLYVPNGFLTNPEKDDL